MQAVAYAKLHRATPGVPNGYLHRLLAMADTFEKHLLQVGMAGFEPAASCSQSRRANQAALHPGAAPTLAGSAGGTAQVYGKVALTLIAAGGRGRRGAATDDGPVPIHCRRG